MTNDRPTCFVIAGSNGAGKSTFARDYLPQYARCPHLINPDLIAAGLSPFDPSQAAAQAARLSLEMIEKYARIGETFAVESTLSGRTYLRILKGLQDRGYDVWIFYLWIPSPELAVERIASRVTEGGHNVPTSDVLRRYGRSLSNFFGLYAPLADAIFLLDNSSIPPMLAYNRISGDETIHHSEIFEQIRGFRT